MIPTLSLNKNSQGRPQRSRVPVNRNVEGPSPQRQRTRGHQFQPSAVNQNKPNKFAKHSSTDSDDDILVIPSNREIDVIKLESINSSIDESETPEVKETASWAPKIKREPIKAESTPKEPIEIDSKESKAKHRPRRHRNGKIKHVSSDEEMLDPQPSQPEKKNEEEEDEYEKPPPKPQRRAVVRQQQFQPTPEKLQELQDISTAPESFGPPSNEPGTVSSDGGKKDKGRDHLTSIVILREKHVFGHAKYKGTVNEKPILVAERESHPQFGKVFTIYKGKEREIVGYLRIQQRSQRFTLIAKKGLEFGEIMGYAYVVPKEGDQQARCISLVGSNNSEIRLIQADKSTNLSRVAKFHYNEDQPIPENCFALTTELPKVTKNGNLQLNFSGAHVVPSVKNFVIRDSEKALLMCFRFSTDCFNVMYCDPFDQLMAFGFCLTALEGVIPD